MGNGESRLETFCFVGLTGELRGKHFPLSAGTTIGRAVNASIFLPDPSLGRQHCRIDVTSAGYQLINCSREPGVLVNDSLESRHLLKTGDVIQLGRFALKVDILAHREVRRNHAQPKSAMSAPAEKKRGSITSRSRAGTVLAARLHADAPGKNLLLAVERFKIHFAKWKVPGAELFADDPSCLRITWEKTPGLARENDEKGLEFATHAACALHRMAFLHSDVGRAMAWSIGIATGEHHAMRWANRRRMLWGDSVARSLELAMRAEPHSTHVGVDASTRAVPADERRAWGWMPSTGGRRRKYSVARLVDLRRPGLDSTAMLVQLTHDPETGCLTMGILDHASFEIGADYTVRTVDGDSLAFRARTCVPIHGNRVRAQLVGLHSPESIARIIGFESMAGAVLIESRRSRRGDVKAA